MRAAVTVAGANGGTLKRLPGGYWAHVGYKWISGSTATPLITDMTIRALVKRGLAEYCGLVEVRVK